MPLPFGQEADFSGLDCEKRFGIREVIHEAVVEVNEEGTEAAAATAVVGGVPVSASRVPRNITFRADHPYLFMIVDHTTQTTLFMGRMIAP